MPITKNPQSYSKQLKIQAILSTRRLVNMTKFHNDKVKNANFLSVLLFGISFIFFRTVSVLDPQQPLGATRPLEGAEGL